MAAQWIWNWGDYEIYHSLLLHARRQEFGHEYPAMWHTDSPEKTVSFRATVHSSVPGYLIAHVCGQGYVEIHGKRYATDVKLALPAGDYPLHIRVVNVTGLPCVYVESDLCPSGAHWIASPYLAAEYAPVGTSAAYTSPSFTPETFPFSYTPLPPVSVQDTPGGRLYDFGKETFARVTVQPCAEESVTVVYGESMEEAMDPQNALLFETVQGQETKVLASRAFRYLQVLGNAKISAEYEYLPLPYRGSFSCSDERMNKIWELSAYTFHLNSREFFLDGVKRDRWVWSADAYQSHMINRYLFFDEAISQRTILALRGKNEMHEHINLFRDHSMYWLISVYDHYQTYGNKAFVAALLPKMRTLFHFVEKELDENGFLLGSSLIGGQGAWVFIDWHEMDRNGALCAEQMVYIHALEAMAFCETLSGGDGSPYQKKAAALKEKLNECFWDNAQGAFIDSYTSGLRHVTRHANIFAVLFGIASPEQQRSILENVLHNDAIPALTTPYFRLYEMDALCRLGCLEEVTTAILDYWGGMIALGATSIWEQFDSRKHGAEHYAMYGNAFGCSLCHAWGAGPIYLLGRHYLGVHSTVPGYSSFEVAPQLGGLPALEGTVPLPDGEVCISLTDQALRVTATCSGGVLKWKGKEYPLIPRQEIFLES